MALPSYWVSQNRKDLAERAIVTKREREAVRMQQCEQSNSYHRNLALNTSKYKNLEDLHSLRTARANEESFVQEGLRAAEKLKVEGRRQKLSHLLSVENDQYMKELKELRDNERERDPWNITRLKAQIDDIQRKRKEAEQVMQKRYMHHHYTSGIVPSRQDDEKIKNETARAWQQQRVELEKINMEKFQKEQEKHKMLELEYQKCFSEIQEVESICKNEEEQWNRIVETKTDEANALEINIHQLKRQREIIQYRLEQLLSLNRKWDSIRDLQRKGFQKMQTMWQPREKLRQMSNEVQHYLEFSYKLLKSINELNSGQLNILHSDEIQVPDLNMNSVINMMENISTHLSIEKEKVLEIQQLYNEEANKLLATSQERWSSESRLRDEQIDEIFKTLKDEINRSIKDIDDEHNKLLELKGTYLNEIDEVKRDAAEKIKSMKDKQEYYIHKANKMKEELEASKTCRSRPPSSVSARVH